MTTEVRMAAADDAADLARLNQAFNGGELLPASEIVESMKRNSELIVVATMNDKVVGFACAQSYKSFCDREGLGEITEMYVEQAARRKRTCHLHD